MRSLEESLDAALKTIQPDSPKATSGNIIIEGVKCRYKREVKSKTHTTSVRIYIEDQIGFSGNGNPSEAIKEAIITLRSSKLNRTNF